MRALWVLALLAGCNKEPRGDTGATRPGADAGVDASTCVADCVKQNQMRATSPEQIERDCRAECTGTPP